jgi:hemolysin
MGLTADIYDIFGFTNHVISEAAALQASITDVTTAVNHFAALLDNQSGATVVSMRNYITGFASSIQAIADAVNMAFTQILMVYQGAYALLDSDAYAVIDEDTISEVLNAYRNSYLWMDDELDIVKEMYYRVCGFTDVTMPSFENAFTRIEEFEAREREYRQALLDTEESFDANELVLLQNLTESSLTYLTGLMPQGYNATTWAHGFVAGANNTASLQFTDNPELYNSILSVVVYTTENTNVINDLSEISRANCERYIIDKRWEEGWKKLSTGAFAMMSGAGALGVALGKAGVLLKVLGFVTGPTAAIFGGAEAAEGLQDIYISVDELDKEAVNKIKARLGEDAYYKILYGSTIASDLVCLAGLVSELNAVPGSLDNLPSGRPGKAPEIGGESGSKTIHNDILDSPRTGSALKVDDVKPIYEINEKTGKPQIIKEFPATAQAHGFNDLVDNYAGYATKTTLNDATLYQLEGSLNGVEGRFEWIIQDGKVTHRMFIQNGAMNGVPIKP